MHSWYICRNFDDHIPMEKTIYTTTGTLYTFLKKTHPNILSADDMVFLRTHVITNTDTLYDKLSIVEIILDEIGLGRTAVLSVLLDDEVKNERLSLAEIEKHFDVSVSTVIKGLGRAKELYNRNAAIETENFRKLLLTFAEDVRVILIMIAERIAL